MHCKVPDPFLKRVRPMRLGGGGGGARLVVYVAPGCVREIAMGAQWLVVSLCVLGIL